MENVNFGPVNGHLIGLAMREMVRRAMTEIARQRFLFQAFEKKSHKESDFVTTADNGAQDIYVRLVRKNFPTFGLIGEENCLCISPKEPTPELWFAIDPLDGTKAFIRRQSHGIGSMISLVWRDKVLAAYVGDVMTKEIFGYHPGSEKVYRISEFEHPEEMRFVPDGSELGDKVVLLRDLPYNHSHFVQKMVKNSKQGGLFRKVGVVEGGSMSLSVARLWKGEVAAIVIPPGLETIWDRAPIIGISQKMGFEFLGVNKNNFFEWTPDTSCHTFDRKFELLIVHGSRLGEIKKWVEDNIKNKTPR